MERNIINSGIEWDVREAVQHTGTNKHLTNLVAAISNCGVAFSIWQKPNGYKKGSGYYDWSSMVGSDKKRVLKTLPDTLEGLLPENSCQEVIKLWKVVSNTLLLYSEAVGIC